MVRSLALLGAEGEAEWDLPVYWLGNDDEGSEDGDDEGSSLGDSNTMDLDDIDRESRSDDEESSDEDDGAGGEAPGAGAGATSEEQGGGVHDVAALQEKIGHFAFFLADDCPVLVAKAVRIEERDGKVGVVVHWYTPSKGSLRGAAATVLFEDYCNTRVTFSPDYVIGVTPSGGRSTRSPDLGWESADRVLVWSKSKTLNANGKKLPKFAVDAVSRAFHSRKEGEARVVEVDSGLTGEAE